MRIVFTLNKDQVIGVTNSEYQQIIRCSTFQQMRRSLKDSGNNDLQASFQQQQCETGEIESIKINRTDHQKKCK